MTGAPRVCVLRSIRVGAVAPAPCPPFPCVPARWRRVRNVLPPPTCPAAPPSCRPSPPSTTLAPLPRCYVTPEGHYNYTVPGATPAAPPLSSTGPPSGGNVAAPLQPCVALASPCCSRTCRTCSLCWQSGVTEFVCLMALPVAPDGCSNSAPYDMEGDAQICCAADPLHNNTSCRQTQFLAASY